MTFFLNGKKIGTAKTNANDIARIKLTASILKAAKNTVLKTLSLNLMIPFTLPAKQLR